MIKITRSKDLTHLRRIALAAQGLLQAHPFGSGLGGARKAIQHLGYVQIDTISVVERAHHHVVYARVPGFKPAMTHKLLRDGNIFEYWSHAAAFMPMEDFRFSLPYKQALKRGQTHWYKNPDRKLMSELLARIRVDGPMRSRDVETSAQKHAGWWDWKPAKVALEQLYMEGDLMISDREGFQKTYDLTERVLPTGVNTQMPDIEEFATHLLDQQLHCHGLVSLKGITYQRRNAALRKAVKTRVDERLARDALQQVQLGSGEGFLVEADALDRRMPRAPNRMSILSPFDNSIIQRDRLRTLFGYDYQIECYVPGPKRKFGYFCLPLLLRDAFIGRMDCKVHRKKRLLEIRSLHFEPHGFDQDFVVETFTDAVSKFCTFQQCDTASLDQVSPKNLSPVLRGALQASVPR